MLRRELAKLEKNLTGIADMEEKPGAVFIVDVCRELNAVKEAARLEIPIVAITDTNADPDPIDYVIPGNDDSVRGIEMIVNGIVKVVKAANDEYSARAAEEAQKRANEAAARRDQEKADRDARKAASRRAAAEAKGGEAAKASRAKAPKAAVANDIKQAARAAKEAAEAKAKEELAAKRLEKVAAAEAAVKAAEAPAAE